MRFLLATDGSAGAQIALEFLCAVPLSCADHVIVVTVPTYSFMGTEGLAAEHGELVAAHGEKAAHVLAERARVRIAARDVPVGVDVRAGPVVQALQDAALEHAADLVVLGSRGLGSFTGSIMGSVARALARHASMPVLVVRERRQAPQRVLVAVDGSDDARAAVTLLARLPLPADAKITLLHVLAGPAPLPHIDDPARLREIQRALDEAEERAGARVLEQAASLLGAHRVDHQIAERGHVAHEILTRAARTDTDLIVLGSRGQTLGGRFLQGSVADQVLSQAHCAVLVAKAPVRPRLVAETRAAPARLSLAL